MSFYARMCGWTLARAHARSGDPVAIAAYLGAGDAFDRSDHRVLRRYADQQRQLEAFVQAARSSRIQAIWDLIEGGAAVLDRVGPGRRRQRLWSR